MVDMKLLQDWALMFAYEGSMIGVTRKLYDAWFNELVNAQYLANVRGKDIDSITSAVIHVMSARVALHTYKDEIDSDGMRLYKALSEGSLSATTKDGVVYKSGYDTFCLACQSFRLSHDVADKIASKLYKLY